VTPNHGTDQAGGRLESSRKMDIGGSFIGVPFNPEDSLPVPVAKVKPQMDWYFPKGCRSLAPGGGGDEFLVGLDHHETGALEQHRWDGWESAVGLT
jgi:hypothetical protein